MADASIDEAITRLARFQTDHLIVLVGTNPLPNYVAARLLLNASNPQHKVWLVHSANTSEIAKQLSTRLAKDSIVSELYKVDESSPIDIRRAILHIAKLAKGRLGLHYTGGTKAMSVHAYLAVKRWAEEENAREPVFSYLDARHVKIVVDAGNPDGTDACIPVDLALPMTVTEIAALHNIKFKKDSPIVEIKPWLLDAANILRTDFETSQAIRNWINKAKMDDVVPADQFPELCAIFNMQLGRDADALSCLNDWAGPYGESTKHLKGWLNGGWLETLVLRLFKLIDSECHLHNSGMNYRAASKIYDPNDPESEKFEFDVAATRGHQLFAVSCTTVDNDSKCKGKLFQALVRAKQLGGDEAKVALVCNSDKPGKLQADFESDNYSAKGSIRIFGKNEFPVLGEHLEQWINTARD